MTKRFKSILLAVLVALGWVSSMWAGPAEAIPYPAGFRQWTHVKSAFKHPQNIATAWGGGFYHVYANEKAMRGYRTGKFPDGSVIVADYLEPREAKGITAEGPRHGIDVMMKDSRKYRETGGWGFEHFKGDSQTERTALTKCFACHTKQKEHDYVFSTFRM
jgi:Cytochrome P460